MAFLRFSPTAHSIVVFGVLQHGDCKRHIRMVVDTGATYVMIPWYIAHELGYKPGQSREWVTIATGNGMILVPKLCVESLSVLGLKVENLAVVCHDLPPAARVDGLLGLSYLRNFNLRIDFKNGILELEKY